MQIKLQGQVFGVETIKSKTGASFPIVKALVQFGSSMEAVRFFLPRDHPAVKVGAADLVVEIGAPRDGFGLDARLVSVVVRA